MKRPMRALLVLMLAAGTAGLGYWLGTRQTSAPDPGKVAAESPAQAGKPARKILYYRNPMGLPDTSPVPKKDSMGMDYIPVYAGDEPDDEGVVKVSPARIQMLGVKTALAEEKALETTVHAVGRVAINERAIYDVAPRFEGWIEHLYVNATGDPVRKGQPLFSVYSPELVSAYKELAIARELQESTRGADPDTRARADRLVQATRERLKNWDMAPGVSRVDASHLRFASPANGIVLEKQAVEGMRFMAGTSIYRIVDLSRVWVLADVYEQDLERLRVGQKATVDIDAFPDRHFTARLSYIYPTLNEATRTTQVRLDLANPRGELRPGMYARVDIAIGGTRPRLTVPLSAIIDNGRSQVVLLALDGGRFKPQPVRVGLRNEDSVEVLDGLKAGDRVVVSANFLIDAESNLKAALANFTAPKEAGQPSAQDGQPSGEGAGQSGAGMAQPAQGAKGAQVIRAVGTLDDIDAESGSVTVTHQPIPALHWPGMTMDFDLARKDVVKGLAPGTPIRFEFEARGPGEYVITRIEATGPAKAKGTGGH